MKYAEVNMTFIVKVKVSVRQGGLPKKDEDGLLKIAEIVEDALEHAATSRFSGNYFYEPTTMVTVKEVKVNLT